MNEGTLFEPFGGFNRAGHASDGRDFVDCFHEPDVFFDGDRDGFGCATGNDGNARRDLTLTRLRENRRNERHAANENAEKGSPLYH